MAIAFSTVKILILLIVLNQFAFLQCGLLIRVNADLAIDILSSKGFLTPIGYYQVTGEIKNVGDTNFGKIILNVDFYDDNNNMICSVNSSSTLSALPPGRKSPFSIYLTNDAQSLMVKSYEVQVMSYQETPMLEKKLVIVSYDYDNESIYGAIENVGYTNATYVRLFATFYDENETVVDVSMSSMFISMERATTEYYEILYPGPDTLNRSIFQRAQWYSLTGESREYSVENETELSYFALPEDGTNDSTNDYSIFYIFAVLVGISAAGLLTAFVIAKSRQKAKRRRLRRSGKLGSHYTGFLDLFFNAEKKGNKGNIKKMTSR